MTTDRATPRPWHQRGRCTIYGSSIEATSKDDGEFTTYICGSLYGPHFGDDEEEGRANAELIVRCVNAHESLVAALEGAEAMIAGLVDTTHPQWRPTLDAAREALQKARGA